MSLRTVLFIGVAALIVIVAINLNRQAHQEVIVEEGTVIEGTDATAPAVTDEAAPAATEEGDTVVEETITPTQDGAVVEETVIQGEETQDSTTPTDAEEGKVPAEDVSGEAVPAPTAETPAEDPHAGH